MGSIPNMSKNNKHMPLLCFFLHEYVSYQRFCFLILILKTLKSFYINKKTHVILIEILQKQLIYTSIK